MFAHFILYRKKCNVTVQKKFFFSTAENLSRIDIASVTFFSTNFIVFSESLKKISKFEYFIWFSCAQKYVT